MMNDAASTSELTVVGHPFAAIGMGEHARSAWRALQAAHTPAGLVDIYGLDRNKDVDFERDFAAHVRPGLGRGVNLFCINGDEVEQALGVLSADAFRDAYNIIYPAWELSKYPAPWARKLELFDEVWAPSEFIRDAVQGAVSRPVVHMPLAVDLKLTSFLGRRHFGIPEHAVVYLFAFDFSSYPARKNPDAVLDAFEALVAERPDAPIHCVIKSKGGPADHPGREALRARTAKMHERVQTITRELSDNENKNLMRCADAFVSLHRSEGFGRGMAEAMALGRVAIGTGYSGNLDFMTPETTLLVDHQIVDVGPDEYIYPEGQVWADPSVEQATRLMAQVLDDPAGARALGERAQRHIRTHFSARAIGLRYRERLEAIAAERVKEPA
jgi:glycosyltransferase involved in cell wall biosynthesis